MTLQDDEGDDVAILRARAVGPLGKRPVGESRPEPGR